jgi:16S rRNA (cytosine1402-N4)-methyltransferase
VEVATALTFDQHLLAQIFQALRIAVNGELTSLTAMLEMAWEKLNKGGNLAIITFHSGEEKRVLQFAKANSIKLAEPIRPSVAELRQNLSARSAKLWTLIKT